jgi:hypothetical protein
MSNLDFSISDVLAWARTKPADEEYDYGRGVWSDSSGGCALCHFLHDTGRATKPVIWPAQYDNGDGEWADNFSLIRYRYPANLEEPLHGGRTFGGLVRLLEALCPETIVAPSEWTKLDAYLTESVGA